MQTAICNIITRALKSRIPDLTEEQVAMSFDAWEQIPYTRGDVIVGCALRNRTELHLIIDTVFQTHICFLKQSKNIVRETIAKYGYAESKVMTEHKAGHRLAAILGFEQVGFDDHSIHYINKGLK